MVPAGATGQGLRVRPCLPAQLSPQCLSRQRVLGLPGGGYEGGVGGHEHGASDAETARFSAGGSIQPAVRACVGVLHSDPQLRLRPLVPLRWQQKLPNHPPGARPLAVPHAIPLLEGHGPEASPP